MVPPVASTTTLGSGPLAAGCCAAGVERGAATPTSSVVIRKGMDRRSIGNLLLCQQHDDRAPCRQQDVAERIRDGVSEHGRFALRFILNRAQGGRTGARSGAGTEQ